MARLRNEGTAAQDIRDQLEEAARSPLIVLIFVIGFSTIKYIVENLAWLGLEIGHVRCMQNLDL